MNAFNVMPGQSWIGRLGGAIKGIFAGLIVLLVSLVLQFWNEGRTLKRDNVLSEGRAAVQTLAEARPDPAREGKLVHVTAEAVGTDAVADAEFGVQVPALALRREVEMYQWRERRDRKKEKQADGSSREVTHYRYETRWDENHIDSARFHDRSGHENPAAIPYAARTLRAENVRVGEFDLAPTIASRLGGWQSLKPMEIVLPPNLAASFRADGDWFTTSADSTKPAVGDVRIRFQRIPTGQVSVVAQQRGASLVPQSGPADAELMLIQRGAHSAQAMFDAEGSSNSKTGWFLRGAGFVLAFIGFALVLRPLTVLADVVPLLGRLAGIGSALVAAVFAGLTSLVAIGSGWLWYRPWLLIVIALLGFALGFALWRARRVPETVPPPPPPTIAPPPPPPGP